jgi:hypothetical protein
MGMVMTVFSAVLFRTGAVRMRVFDRTEFLDRFDGAAAKLRYRRIEKTDGSLVYEPKALLRTEATRIFVALGPDEAVATGPLMSLKRLKEAIERAGTA